MSSIARAVVPSVPNFYLQLLEGCLQLRQLVVLLCRCHGRNLKVRLRATGMAEFGKGVWPAPAAH